ncbi:MAG: peptidase S41 [Candidatus Cloacimonetes bacterium]|nr:peptidase S41 [Candidatus Cloacimonadota bacterium]
MLELIRKYQRINYSKIFIAFIMILTPLGIGAQNISQVDRIHGISKFWQESNYNFAYFENIPNKDFDSLYKHYLKEIIDEENDYKYYRKLQKFCAELKDGHTQVFMPDYLRKEIFYPPIRIRRIKDKVYIINVGKSYVEKIPRGSRILKVEGMDVLDYLRQKVYPYISAAEHIVKSRGAKIMLEGLINTDVDITIKKPNGGTKKIAVHRDGKSEKWYYPVDKARGSEIVEFKQLENKIGYIALNSFAHKEVVEKFKELLPKLYKQKAIIIDLRNNGGGNSGYAHRITKYFTDKSYFLGEVGSTRKHIATYKAWGALADSNYADLIGMKIPSETMKNNTKYLKYYHNNAWKKEDPDSIKNDVEAEKLLMPLVILTSNSTASAAEDFLVGMEYLNRATIIGQKTNGSTGQPIYFSLPECGLFRICTRKCTYPDGKKFVGTGIIPDIEVKPTLDYYLSGEGTVLDKAAKYLEKIIKR